MLSQNLFFFFLNGKQLMNSDMICGDSGREGRGRKELLNLGNPTEEMLGPQGTRLEEDGELWAPGVSIAPGT